MLSHKPPLATRKGRRYALALGIVVCTSAHLARASGPEAAGAWPAGGLPHFRETRGAAFVPPEWTANFDQYRHGTGDPVQVSFDGEAAQPPDLTAGATTHARGQADALVARPRPGSGSAPGRPAPVDASLSYVLARLHHGFGSDLGLARDRARQGEGEVLVRNADALVRAKVRLTPGTGWLGFLYADIGAVDSALKWQGLADIPCGHGLDLLGGWRHVTYHFSPGQGFDSIDFNGPFVGATLAW